MSPDTGNTSNQLQSTNSCINHFEAIESLEHLEQFYTKNGDPYHDKQNGNNPTLTHLRNLSAVLRICGYNQWGRRSRRKSRIFSKLNSGRELELVRKIQAEMHIQFDITSTNKQ